MVPGPSISPVPGTPALPAQPAAEQREVETEMGPAVTIMKPILRFLQLLCENHNHDLQVSLLMMMNQNLQVDYYLLMSCV